MSNKIFLSCEEANHTCDKTQYNEGSLLEKIKLNIHLVFCSACRKYSKNNSKLSKLFKQKPITLATLEKTKLQAAFNKQLAKQNNE